MTQADFDRSQSIAKLVDKLHDGQHVYLQIEQVNSSSKLEKRDV